MARILIVDDEHMLADVVADILRDRGAHETVVAINGRLGLARLAERAFDLVILDLMMPVMDGHAMLAAMRASKRNASTPVIIMTAAPHAIGPQTPRHQGLLRKPFPADALIAAVDRALSDQQAPRIAAKQARRRTR